MIIIVAIIFLIICIGIPSVLFVILMIKVSKYYDDEAKNREVRHKKLKEDGIIK